ncbi:cation:proton antiporter [Rothia sp. CCM 9417]|uniref:cation:proton antiporter n=1 Tax=Rothia sp. CCM 9417 TaxID=3402657 RepID=UPI003AED6277
MPFGASETTTLLAAGSSTTSEYISIFWISLVALLAPLASNLVRKKIPDVVFLIIFGTLIGPHVLGLASGDEGVSLLKDIGLGLLFLLAGYEVNTASLRGRQGGFAAGAWAVSFTLGSLLAMVLTGFKGDLSVYAVIGIAMSSTALGTLLPLLKSHGKTGTTVGESVMVHGAIGEVLPIFAMSLLLSSHSPWLAALILVAFMLVALFSAILPHRLFEKIPGLSRTMAAEANTTSQTMLRLAMLLLATLMMVAAVFNLDVVLGAFAAGVILRSLTPDGAFEPFSKRLEALGFSFLIPLFFVCSGMGITVSVIWEQPLTLAALILGILLVRGLPVVLAERFLDTGSGLQTPQERLQLGLYASAGLPMIVAVTEVALAHNLLTEHNASLLVTGGALTVLLFPLWASAIGAVAKGSSTPTPEVSKDSRELRSAKKQERSAAVQAATGVMPLVKEKGE